MQIYLCGEWIIPLVETSEINEYMCQKIFLITFIFLIWWTPYTDKRQIILLLIYKKSLRTNIEIKQYLDNN